MSAEEHRQMIEEAQALRQHISAVNHVMVASGKEPYDGAGGG